MNLKLTDGIQLTELRRSDQDAMIEYLNDRTIYEHTARIPYPYTVADAERRFLALDKLQDEHGQTLKWAIRSASGKLIGSVGFEGLDLEQSHRAEIGYWLARPYRRQGIMTAVVRAVCEHGFSACGFSKITALVFSFNVASCKLLEKCGFEYEGYFKRHYLKDGRFIDAKAYGLVK